MNKWLLVEGPPGCVPNNYVASGPGGTVYSLDEEGRATVRASYTYDMETARLVAAAPLLLEALKGILEIGKRDTTNPKYDGYYDQAREAVNAAEGRTA